MAYIAEEFDGDLETWSVTSGAPVVSGGTLNLTLTGNDQIVRVGKEFISYGDLQAGYVSVLPVLPSLGSSQACLRVLIYERIGDFTYDKHLTWFTHNWPGMLELIQEQYNPALTSYDTGPTGWAVFYVQNDYLHDFRPYEPATKPWSRIDRSGYDYGWGMTSAHDVIPPEGSSGGPLTYYASEYDNIYIDLEARSGTLAGSAAIGVDAIRAEYSPDLIQFASAAWDVYPAPSAVPNLLGNPNDVRADFSPPAG